MSDAIVDGRFDFPGDSFAVRDYVARGRRRPSTPEDWHLYTGRFVPARYDASFELPRAELERCAAALNAALARAEQAVRDGTDPLTAWTTFVEPVADDPDYVDAGTDDDPVRDVALFWLATTARRGRGTKIASSASPEPLAPHARRMPMWKIVIGGPLALWAAVLGLAAAVERGADLFGIFLAAGIAPLALFLAVAGTGRSRIAWGIAGLVLLRLGIAVFATSQPSVREP